jgi:hypothetical protein
MTSIAVFRDDNDVDNQPRFTAVTNTGALQSVGKTMGEAIDALTQKLPAEESNGIVIVVQPRGDKFFSEAQITRLNTLMDQARASALSPDEQDELEALIKAELVASGQRAAHMAGLIGR